jgi:hypothetical protein
LQDAMEQFADMLFFIVASDNNRTGKGLVYLVYFFMISRQNSSATIVILFVFGEMDTAKIRQKLKSIYMNKLP